MNAKKGIVLGIVFGIVCLIAGMTFVTFTNSNVAQGSAIIPAANNGTHYVTIECPMCDDDDNSDTPARVTNTTKNETTDDDKMVYTNFPHYSYDSDNDGEDGNLTVLVKKNEIKNYGNWYPMNFTLTTHEFKGIDENSIFGVSTTDPTPEVEETTPVVDTKPTTKTNDNVDKTDNEPHVATPTSSLGWMQKALVKASATGICGGEL